MRLKKGTIFAGILGALALAGPASASEVLEYHARLKVARGAHAFTWRPSRAGAYTLTLEGLDLLKNKRALTQALRVR